MDRKEAEMAFHDQRERDRQALSDEQWMAKYSNKKWYAAVRKSRRFIDEWFERNCQGKVALDFGCGLGGVSQQLAEAGAEVYAIDISPESVATTQKRLAERGLADRLHAQPMDGENLAFENDKFDIIVCSGVLHHVDVTQVFPELARVLKPTGSIIAIEALGYNPVINLYRRMTPSLRTEWEVDHILTNKELRIARQFFGRIDVKYFHLFSILAVPFRKKKFFAPLLSLLDAVDGAVLSIPLVRLLAWQMVFLLSEPKR